MAVGGAYARCQASRSLEAPSGGWQGGGSPGEKLRSLAQRAKPASTKSPGRNAHKAPQRGAKPRAGAKPPLKPRSGRAWEAQRLRAAHRQAQRQQGQPTEARSELRARLKLTEDNEPQGARSAHQGAKCKAEGWPGGRAKLGRWAADLAREAAAGGPLLTGRATRSGAAAPEWSEKQAG